MRKLLMAGVAGALLAAGLAVAETPAAAPDKAGKPEHGWRGHRGPHGGFFDAADANHDGVVTRAEYEAFLKAEFKKLDTNGDGVLNRADREARRAEFKKAHEKDAQKGPEGPKTADADGPRHDGGRFMHARHMHQGWGPPPGYAFFAMERCAPGPIDKNGDGKISREEFLAGPNAVFDKLDANHDGFLDGAELMNHMALGAGPHGPQGGPEGGPEAGKPGEKGKDEGVKLDEFVARGMKRFDALDANHDGKLTKAEFEATRPPGPCGPAFGPGREMGPGFGPGWGPPPGAHPG